jgi:hypothetical protein
MSEKGCMLELQAAEEERLSADTTAADVLIAIKVSDAV